MSQSVIQAGTPVNLTASGNVTTKNTTLIGFYVNSTTVGTLQLKKGGSGGTAIGGVITPTTGWNPYPAVIPGGLYALIAGTALDVTFFVEDAS